MHDPGTDFVKRVRMWAIFYQEISRNSISIFPLYILNSQNLQFSKNSDLVSAFPGAEWALLLWICKNCATRAHLAFNMHYYNEFIIIFGPGYIFTQMHWLCRTRYKKIPVLNATIPSKKAIFEIKYGMLPRLCTWVTLKSDMKVMFKSINMCWE